MVEPDGAGCEECDQTGRRFRQTWATEDGVTISVSGSGSFNPELLPLFEEVAKAAGIHLDRMKEGQPE